MITLSECFSNILSLFSLFFPQVRRADLQSFAMSAGITNAQVGAPQISIVAKGFAAPATGSNKSIENGSNKTTEDASAPPETSILKIEVLVCVCIYVCMLLFVCILYIGQLWYALGTQTFVCIHTDISDCSLVLCRTCNFSCRHQGDQKAEE